MHLQGFKSFKERTTIYFDDGITGIVGPNGCGKSNIVDALFWVMGEQSVKHLRGSSMRDLIFSGSEKHRPASFAQVDLVLQNEELKHIHIGQQVVRPSEIQLTRKVYRNGETEYRINSSPCRLRDIQEVFMDTGAGAKSYSIIAQGEINRLVQAKPEERRTMIEEVAGITKFKMRKKESLRKMEQTTANLERISDLKSEIKKNLRGLEAQAEKAKKARTLKQKVRKYDLIVSGDQCFHLLRGLDEARKRSDYLLESKEEASRERAKIENELELDRQQKLELTEQLDEQQLEINQLGNKLAAGEERVLLLRKSIEDKRQLQENYSKDVQQIHDDQRELTEEEKKVAAEISELVSRQNETLDLAGMEAELGKSKDNFSDSELLLKTLCDKNRDVEQSVFDSKRELESIRLRRGVISEDLSSLELEISEIDSQSIQLNAQLLQAREQVATKESLAAEITKKTTELKRQLQETETQLVDASAEANHFLEKKTRAEAQKESLESFFHASEMSEQDAKALSEILGDFPKTLAHALEVPDAYRKSCETVLENQLNDVLCSGEFPFEKIEALLSKNLTATLAVFLPEQSSETNQESSGADSHARPFLRFDVQELNQFITAPDDLFKNCYICSDEEFLKIQKEEIPEGSWSLVNQSGSALLKRMNSHVRLQVFQDGGKNEGLLHTLAKIEQLSGYLQKFQNNYQTVVEKSSKLKSEKSRLIGELADINAAREQTFRQLTEFKSDLQVKEKMIHQGHQRISPLRDKFQKMSTERVAILERQEELAKVLETSEKQQQELETELNDATEARNSNEKVYREKQEIFTNHQVSIRTFATQQQALNDKMKSIASQNEKLKQRQSSLEEMIGQLSPELEKLEKEVQNLIQQNQGLVVGLESCEKKRREVQENLQKMIEATREQEDQVKKLSKEMSESEKEMGGLEIKVEQMIKEEEFLTRDTLEKYRLNLREYIFSNVDLGSELKSSLGELVLDEDQNVLEEDSEIAVYEFKERPRAVVRDFKDRLKACRKQLGQLGEINWQAVAEYDKQKIRYDFLRSEEEVLQKSFQDLLNAIEHIDKKSHVRFKTAFKEVNEKFSKVFPIIFGGGQAKLDLKGGIDDNDSGIEIVASPPGKKMQSINLMSGGEKALTAVSLIFSIFLVKPSPFCLLDEVDAPLDDANVGRFNDLLREMSSESQFILITHNKRTMELNDTLYGITMQEPGVSSAVSVQLQ